jgi:ClpP class serine protease
LDLEYVPQGEHAALGGKALGLSGWIAGAWTTGVGLYESFLALAAAWPIPVVVTGILVVAILATLFLRQRVPPHDPSPNRQIEQLARIQRLRGSRVIAIIHRETHSGGIFFGGPERSYIDLNDFEGVVAAISATSKTRPLDIVLHTEGGDALAALQIARAVKAHPARKTVFIPYFAMSGGTLIALAADEIVMSDHAVLGPIDPQIAGWPAASIVKIVKDKPIAAVNDFTLIQADVAQKAMDQMRRQACELMEGTYNHDGSCAISDELASGKWTHSYPISVPEARDLGLRVSTDMPREIVDLVALYPGPLPREPSVQYLPGHDGRA